MRVLVDTSACVDLLNGHPSPQAAARAELLAGDDDICTCGVVVAEVFQGLRRDSTRGEIAGLFEEMTFLEPGGIAAYFRAADLYRTLRQKGRTVRSTIDRLIAALAEANGCWVLARDRETILGSGLVDARLWQAVP